MKDLVFYVHGKGGSAAECGHYGLLFPGCEVVGYDGPFDTPWEAGKTIRETLGTLSASHGRITLIANSIGAYYSMGAGIADRIRRAYFISPIVDLEALILGMMAAEGVTEETLEARGRIPSGFGEDLSWEYLRYVREHPIRWDVPTEILYGSCDSLTPYGTMAAFADRHGAGLTVMEGGEHWFHTEAQMRFLDAWIRSVEPG